MSDSTPFPHEVSPDSQASDTGPTTAALAASVRKLRVWLSVLTAFVVLVSLAACAGAALFGVGIAGVLEQDPGVTKERIASTRQEFETALGDRLQSLDVRAVNMEYGDAPFPFFLLGGGPGKQKAVYVEYRLKGSSVVIADVLDSPFEADASPSGLLPTKGSLRSRMTDEQFAQLLDAYGAETKSPLGSVRRYDDRSTALMPSEAPVGDKVVVGKKEYPANELWAATVGRLVQGDRIDMSVESSFMRKVLVFHEDSATGKFIYLGTEDSAIGG